MILDRSMSSWSSMIIDNDSDADDT